jgi:hypothetical protein
MIIRHFIIIKIIQYLKKISHGVYTCLDHGAGHRNLEFKKYYDKVFGNTDGNINNLKIIVP